MKGQDRVDLVLRLHEARNARDNDATRELVSPEMAIHYRLGVPAFRGDWVGLRPEPGSALAFGLMLWGMMADGSARLEVLEAAPIGEHLVFARGVMTMTLEGEDWSLPTVQVFRVEGDRVVELFDFPDPIDPSHPLAKAGERARAQLEEFQRAQAEKG
jgi:hypothetical protein